MKINLLQQIKFLFRPCLFLFALLAIETGFTQTTQIFNVPGTYSWTVPPCVTSVTVQAWGGGGGGGGVASYMTSCSMCSYVEACSAGGGGGGGGFVTRTYTVVPGQTYTIIVGAGGTAGPATSSATSTARDGSAGGNSSFSGPATSIPGTLIAYGGNGGLGALINNNSNWTEHLGTNGNGGVGGTGVAYTTMYQGGTGATGKHDASCWDQSGGGGGGGGTSAVGGFATTLVCYGSVAGGAGGVSLGGNGANGCVGNSTSSQYFNGNVGTTIGGGGGGGLIHLRDWFNSWRTNSGGAGARGEVRLLYTGITPPSISGTPQVCEGTMVNLTASGSFVTYSWNTGAGTTGISVTPVVTTTYTVTGTDGSGCTASEDYTITVDPAPAANAGIDVTNICAGDPVTLTASPTPANTQSSYTFEASNPFTIVNGTQYNKWYHGTAASCSGSYGLYIGTAATNNTYVNATSGFITWTQRPSVTFAYIDIPITECQASLDFNWKCLGKATDNLSVWIVPTSTVLTAGTALVNSGSVLKIGGDYWNAGGSCSAVAGLNLIQGWVSVGQTIRLVFQWRNAGSGVNSNTAANPAGMIDNVVVTQTDNISFSWTSSASGFTSGVQNTTDNPSVSTTYTVLATACNGCSANATVDVVVDPCPLPIELISFTGTCEERSIDFEWVTATEYQNDYFTIEESSNGIEFTSVAMIDGAGSSQSQNDYSFNLPRAFNESSYYRLKQTDLNGSSSLSDVIHVFCAETINEDGILMFPNPASENVVITLGRRLKGEFTLSILDVLGKEILRQQLSSESTQTILDVRPISRGNYIVMLLDSSDQYIDQKILNVVK